MPRPETGGCVIAAALALAASRAALFTDVASFFAGAAGKETGATGCARSADGEMAAAALPRLCSAVTAVLLRLSGAEALRLFG